ncbi:MAG: hypothetical protein IPO17_13655 [Flavobacteriales bacterium]|nr:hypothetical protein [Flavobacteriales bacterium]
MNTLREKKGEEPVEKKAPKAKAKVPTFFIGILNGSFLTKQHVLGNMSFILWCAGLMLTYIAYGYYTERTVRDLQTIDAEVKELKSEYHSERWALELEEQQSNLATEVQPLGLVESTVRPQQLEVDEDLLETPEKN